MTNLYKIFEQHPIVTTDSRNIPDGSMYFALKGEKFDGNLFAAEALSKGAAYAVIDDPRVATSDNYILVEDVLSTLQRLATYHRRALGIPILAITGSNGKTTTKELLAKVLSKRYNVSVTAGNLNNHIGVPLTLLSFRRGIIEFGVVEMGASARGEIELLSNIAQPDFGLITNIGRAHLEGFGSPEGVMAGKGELLDYLAAHRGLAFYFMDDARLSEMVESRQELLASGYSLQSAAGIKSKLAGDYNRLNIAAAAAIGEYFGVIPREIQDAIESYIPDNMRSQRVEKGSNTLILDCYNANPSSMKAAIENLVGEHTSKTKAVILGDMLELGSYSKEEHEAVLDLLLHSGIKNTYLVGPNFTAASESRGLAIFPDTQSLSSHLSANHIKHHLILIKGSRGIGLERLVDII